MKNIMNTMLRYIIAFFCFLLPITIIILTTLEGRPAHILWFCYTGLIIVGIGLLMKNGNVIASQANLLIIPLITWNIDFVIFNVTGLQFFGQVNYGFFSESLLTQVLVIQHILTIPLLIYLLFVFRPTKSVWKFSILQATILYIIIRFATDAVYNVSCVYENCVSAIPLGNWYPLVWFIAVSFYTGITDLCTMFFFKRRVTHPKKD